MTVKGRVVLTVKADVMRLPAMVAVLVVLVLADTLIAERLHQTLTARLTHGACLCVC